MTETLARRLEQAIGSVFLGKEDVVQLAVITLLAGGHLLVEDRPGVGKTLLARSLARCLELPFQRLQCTADLLPADILGAQVYQPDTGDIVFRPGPVFTSVLVADELNRTPPRTQSALLQSMEEGRVSIERTTHDLPRPFFVVATQNPVSHAGTYPLPENQLDRFLMRIDVGYLAPADEARVLLAGDGHEVVQGLQPVGTADDVLAAQRQVREVRIADELVQYMVQLADRTRTSPSVELGISTRGLQALYRACQARAVARGRDYVTPDDLRTLIRPTLQHRLQCAGGEESAEAYLIELQAGLPLPD